MKGLLIKPPRIEEPENVAAGLVDSTGQVVDEAGKPVAKITEGKPQDLVGNIVAATGDIINTTGDVVGKAVPLSEEEAKDAPTSEVQKKGGLGELGLKGVTDTAGSTVSSVGKLQPLTGQLTKVLGGGESDATTSEKGEVKEGQDEQVDETEEVNGAKENLPEPINMQDESATDLNDDSKTDIPEQDDATLQKDNKQDEVPGDEKLEDTKIQDDDAVEKTEEGVKDDIPADKDDDAVEKTEEGVKDDIPADKSVDTEEAKDKEDNPATDDIKSPSGEDVPAEDAKAEDPATEAEKIDFSILKDCKVNKAGNVVNDKSQVVGRITEGILKNLVGRKTDANGEIWNDSGKVIGKAEPIPETEREEFKEPSPFEDFPDATVESNGKVTHNGEVVGRVIEGDAKKLKGKKVDEDGDILDRAGNVLGKAERWEEEEPEPEPEVTVDKSILAGKRVNKLGNVVDGSGTIFGRLVEGDPKRLSGRMCDKDGNVRSESGDVIGRAELVPEGEREGLKEGPFAELPGCTVNKEGKVVTPGGDVVGRLVKGDPKTLFGRAVDEDGDILDKNGNSLGKAERWEEPEVEKDKNPMCGRKVNREGNVIDTDGNLIGKLTSGELSVCSGKEIDNDGDVVDSKGNTVGHVSLLADIPAEEKPEETAEEKEKRELAEQDKKLAKQMATTLTQCLDKIRPICKMISQKIDKADRTPKEELDEEALVKEVRPLIEEGSKILQESNGIIRGLDPDGHIQANAKHKSASREATPEEHHLADVLKEITGTVTECIDNAKKKIEDMPHAKKELNPLWGLMTEPLFQILAAVGLLLNGVLELVGRLVSCFPLVCSHHQIFTFKGVSNPANAWIYTVVWTWSRCHRQQYPGWSWHLERLEEFGRW